MLNVAGEAVLPYLCFYSGVYYTLPLDSFSLNQSFVPFRGTKFDEKHHSIFCMMVDWAMLFHK